MKKIIIGFVVSVFTLGMGFGFYARDEVNQAEAINGMSSELDEFGDLSLNSYYLDYSDFYLDFNDRIFKPKPKVIDKCSQFKYGGCLGNCAYNMCKSGSRMLNWAAICMNECE